MQTFGDLALVASIIIALIFVPPYLWKQYGGPPVGAWIVNTILSIWSGSTYDDAGSGAGSRTVVPAQQHQPAPELVPDFEYVLHFLRRHNLTDEQMIDVLSVLRRESGDLMSANKIRDTVGGNEKDVKARVASHRPKPPQPRSQGRLVRPEGGW